MRTLWSMAQRCLQASDASALTALVSPEEAQQLSSEANLLDLLALSQQVRSCYAPAPSTCGIINAKSGRCAENCTFCAQSGHYQTHAPVYPLQNADSLCRRAEELAQAGASRFGIVTSGSRLSSAERDALCASVHLVRERVDIAVCASLGQLAPEDARCLHDAGITRYHHNLETSRSFFPQICTTHDYDDDIATLHVARAAGFELCCGGIFGLGESWEQRVELAMTLRELDVDAIPINFLNPIPGTPLEKQERLHAIEALRILALYRLLHPGRSLIVCGGRSCLEDYDNWLFMAGANALMIGNYLTTKGASFDHDARLLQDLGLA